MSRHWVQSVMTTKLGWNDKSKQRKFLEDVAKKLNIKEQKDWGSITRKQVSQLGGGSLLVQYNNSLIKALSNVFSGNERVLLTLRPYLGS